MFKFQEIWLPDGEKHFPIWMERNGEIVDGKGTYQIKKFREAMKWVKNWRTAVDVGGHVGLWAMQMAKHFQFVHAFEPMSVFRECFIRNLGMPNDYCDGDDDIGNVRLHSCALGAKPGKVRMNYDTADSGGTHVIGEGDIDLCTLDSFHYADIDFIKIDCEGYEHPVMKGAYETIVRCKPCVIVEQKRHKLGPNFGIEGHPAVDMLRDMGAVLRKEIGGDYIMSWD